MNIQTLGLQPLAGLSAKFFTPLERGAVESFAQEIARRAEQTQPAKGLERTVTGEGLEKAVVKAVDYVKDAFGGQAARTVMGIVLQQAPNGPLTEDALGQGFVNALEFIDRTFGIAAGDRAMDFFNGQLNQALNGFFQNGKNETFLATDTALEAASGEVSRAVSAVMRKFEENAADPQDLLSGGNEEGAPKDATEKEPQAAAGASPESGQADPAQETRPVAKGKRGRGKRSLRRRRLGSHSGYERSGLAPGAVVNKSV